MQQRRKGELQRFGYPLLALPSVGVDDKMARTGTIRLLFTT